MVEEKKKKKKEKRNPSYEKRTTEVEVFITFTKNECSSGEDSLGSCELSSLSLHGGTGNWD
jgi:hypothetical protein